MQISKNGYLKWTKCQEGVMSTDASKNLRSADERWIAIKRTQRKMAAPPGGEDIGALLAKSLDAYWTQHEEDAQVAKRVEIPGIFRRAASLFRNDFWSDFAFASVPVALVLLIGWATTQSGILLPDWWHWAASAVTLLLLTVTLVALRSRRVAWLEYSGGALVAGLTMALLTGVYVYRQTQASNSFALATLQVKLADIAVVSLQSKQDTGRFLNTHLRHKFLSVETAAISSQEAIYKASAKNFPGKLIAELGPRSGSVRWTARNPDDVRVTVAAGMLVRIEKEAWLFRADGRDLWLKASPESLDIQPTPGNCLVVAFKPNPGDGTVMQAVRLHACSRSITDQQQTR
jgi:hypothetical protein